MIRIPWLQCVIGVPPELQLLHGHGTLANSNARGFQVVLRGWAEFRSRFVGEAFAEWQGFINANEEAFVNVRKLKVKRPFLDRGGLLVEDYGVFTHRRSRERAFAVAQIPARLK